MTVQVEVKEPGDHTSHGVDARELTKIRKKLASWLGACRVSGNVMAFIVRGTPDGHAHQAPKAIRPSQGSVYIRVGGCFLFLVVPSTLGISAEELFARMCEQNGQRAKPSDELPPRQLSKSELEQGREQLATAHLLELMDVAEQYSSKYYRPHIMILVTLYCLAEREKDGWINPWTTMKLASPDEVEIMAKDYMAAVQAGALESNSSLPFRIGMQRVVKYRFTEPAIREVRKCLEAYEAEQQRRRDDAKRRQDEGIRRRRDQRERIQSGLATAKTKLVTACEAVVTHSNELEAIEARIKSRGREIAELEAKLAGLKKLDRQDRSQDLPRCMAAKKRTSEALPRLEQEVSRLEQALAQLET